MCRHRDNGRKEHQLSDLKLNTLQVGYAMVDSVMF